MASQLGDNVASAYFGGQRPTFYKTFIKDVLMEMGAAERNRNIQTKSGETKQSKVYVGVALKNT